MEGVVSKSTGSWYAVRNREGRYIQCRIKGKFRLEGIKHTNPVAVGDVVEFEMEEASHTGIIHAIRDRKNYIIRKASNLSKQTHIIAANLDQAVLMATLAYPKTSLGFIDRFLVTAEAYHIPAVLLFNKVDLLTGELQARLHAILDLYGHKIGYRCIQTSAHNRTGIAEVKELLASKTTLICGHSGVGKSSLLNIIEPLFDLRTGEISNYSSKGQHTTTFAEMHELSFGGFIIDTPGIREFGIVDVDEVEISHYFKEMQPLIGSCRFNNCKHINEPGCAVKAAVETGSIAPERYKSYISILRNEDFFE